MFLLFLGYITLVSRQDTVDWPEWCVIVYVACLAVDKIREVCLLLHKHLYACHVYPFKHIHFNRCIRQLHALTPFRDVDVLLSHAQVSVVRAFSISALTVEKWGKNKCSVPLNDQIMWYM